MKKDTVLITGARGFVGSVITRAFVKKGYPVHTLVRDKRHTPRLADIEDKLAWHEYDLFGKDIERIIDKIKPSIVLHFAAYGTRPNQLDMREMIKINIEGTLYLLKAIKKHRLKAFIYSGSSSEYGMKTNPMKESDIPVPLDDYGVTKAAATMLCQKFALRDGLPVAVFRLFSPYGYYEDAKRFIPYLITNALLDKPILLSNPSYVRDFIFIEDIIDIYMRAIEDFEHVRGEIVNVGSGQQHSIEDVVKSVIKLTGTSSRVTWHVEKRTHIQEPLRWQADIAKAQKLLRWTPQHTLQDGLEKTIAWIKKNGYFYA